MVENVKSNSEKWWETAVIYQIYPLTFADSNGDGIGDLQGIIEKLDYLNDGNADSETSLGIDAIWLSPINQSPMVDNGYDISDYYDISDTFGTLEDFDILLSESHQRGIKVILDLVVNHTSNQHSWFLESSASKDNPKTDWYHWQDPAPDGGVPNNWLSYFGGTGWTFNEARQQYYYHTFNQNQPDLNWSNPEVKAAIFQMIRFWLDRGVDGFRLDASSVYSKDKYYRYNPVKFGATDQNNYNNQLGRWNTLIHYPYEHLAYTRKTEAETVLVIVNFSYEKDLNVDGYVAPHSWEVLVSNERETGKIIDLPSKLYPFEVSVLRRDN